MIYDAVRGVQRYPEISKMFALSCFLIKDVRAHLVLILFVGTSERQRGMVGWRCLRQEDVAHFVLPKERVVCVHAVLHSAFTSLAIIGILYVDKIFVY